MSLVNVKILSNQRRRPHLVVDHLVLICIFRIEQFTLQNLSSGVIFLLIAVDPVVINTELINDTILR